MPPPTANSPALLVAQSGGATAVINASLVGAIEAARDSTRFGRVLGARNGIEGVLQDRLIDLHDQAPETLSAIRRTPSAALGTGRHKLNEDDLDLALERMRILNISAFVYIGGNDSADTAHRLATRAAEIGQELAVALVPKTIDNDLMETDHCPGYGSIARYIGNAVRDATYDSIAHSQLYPVKFVETMGRDAGWVAASSALGFSDAEHDLLPIVLLPERPPENLSVVLAAIERDLASRGWSVVVVPETLCDATGQHVGGEEPEYSDAFGHPYFPSAGSALTRLVTRDLGVRARYDKPGTAARMSISFASDVNLAEAYALGAAAVERLVSGQTGFATILCRTGDNPYACDVGAMPIERIANKVRCLPDKFIAATGMGITDEFRRYAMPLLGTEPFPLYRRFDFTLQDG